MRATRRIVIASSSHLEFNDPDFGTYRCTPIKNIAVEMSLQAYIDSLIAVQTNIPSEFQHTSEITYSRFGELDDIEISYERPLNPEELSLLQEKQSKSKAKTKRANS